MKGEPFNGTLMGMKFHNADFKDLEQYICDRDYWFEQKADGLRAQLRIVKGDLRLLGYRGELLRSTMALKALPGLQRDCKVLMDLSKEKGHPIIHIDGEIVGSATFWAFDLLDWGSSIRDQSLELRRAQLEEVFTVMFAPKGNSERMKLLPVARYKKEKQRLLRKLIKQQAEGLLLKNKNAHYEPGRRVYHSLKLKFTKTVDCVVLARNHDRDANAVLGVYDGKEIKEIGRCSMIGKPPARVGDVIEVEYLDFINRITQPRMTRMRMDKKPKECTIDQLESKSKEIISL